MAEICENKKVLKIAICEKNIVLFPKEDIFRYTLVLMYYSFWKTVSLVLFFFIQFYSLLITHINIMKAVNTLYIRKTALALLLSLNNSHFSIHFLQGDIDLRSKNFCHPHIKCTHVILLSNICPICTTKHISKSRKTSCEKIYA